MAKPDFKKDERVVLAPGTHRAGQQATVISVQPVTGPAPGRWLRRYRPVPNSDLKSRPRASGLTTLRGGLSFPLRSSRRTGVRHAYCLADEV